MKGRRPLDAALNLVPFIDLMAVTIVFLIMTAVWTQVGRLQLAPQTHDDSFHDVVDLLPVQLVVLPGTLRLSVGRDQLEAVPITRDERGRIDVARLAAQLRQLKQAQPELTAITISSGDEVPYADLVRVLDTVMADAQGELFPSVTVSPASAG